MKKIIKLMCIFVAFIATCIAINIPKAKAAEMPITVDFSWNFDGMSSVDVAPSELDGGDYTLDNFVDDYLSRAVVKKTARGNYILESDHDGYFLLDGFTDDSGTKKTTLTASSDSYSLSLTDYKTLEVDLTADDEKIELYNLEDLRFYEVCPLTFSSTDDYKKYYDVEIFSESTYELFAPAGVSGYLYARYYDIPLYSSKMIYEGDGYLEERYYNFRVYTGSGATTILDGYNTELKGYYPSGTNVTASITAEEDKNIVVYSEDFNFRINYIGDNAEVSYSLYQPYSISFIEIAKRDGQRAVRFYIDEMIVHQEWIDNDAIFNVSDYEYLLEDTSLYEKYYMFNLEAGWAEPEVIEGQPIVVHLAQATPQNYYIWDVEVTDKDGNTVKPTSGGFELYEISESGVYYTLSGTVNYDEILGHYLFLYTRPNLFNIYVTINSLEINGKTVELESDKKFEVNDTLSTLSVYEVGCEDIAAINPIEGIGYVTETTTDIRFSVKPGWTVSPDGTYNFTDGVYIFSDVDVSNGYNLVLNAEAAPVTILFYTADPAYETSTKLDELTINAKVGDKLYLPEVYDKENDGRVAVWWQSTNVEFEMYDPYAIYTEDGILELYPYTVETAGSNIEIHAYRGSSEVDSSRITFKFSSDPDELIEINGGYISDLSDGEYRIEYAADLDVYLFISIDDSEYFNMRFHEKVLFKYYYVGAYISDHMSVSGNGWYEEGKATIVITPEEGYIINLFGSEYDKSIMLTYDEDGALYCYTDHVEKSLEMKFGASVDNGTYSLYLMVEGNVYQEVIINESITDLAEINELLQSEDFISQYPGYTDSEWIIEDTSFEDGKIVNPTHNIFGMVSNKANYVMFNFNAYNVFGDNYLKGDLETLEIHDAATTNILNVDIKRIGTKYYFLLPDSVTEVYAYIGDEIFGKPIYASMHEIDVNNMNEYLNIYSIKLHSYDYVEDVSGEGFYAYGQQYNLRFKEKEGYENFVYKIGLNRAYPTTDGEYKTYKTNGGSVDLIVTADAMDVAVQFILGGTGGTVGLEVTYKTGQIIEIPSYKDIVGLPVDKMLSNWYFASGPLLEEGTKCPYDPLGIAIYNDLISCNYFIFSATIQSDQEYTITEESQIKLSSSKSSLVETNYVCNYSETMGMYLVKYTHETDIYVYLDYKKDDNFTYFEVINTANMGENDYHLVELYTQELDHVSCDLKKFYIIGDTASFVYTVEKGYTLLINDDDLTLEQIDDTSFKIETLVDRYKEIVYSVDYASYYLTFLLEEDGEEIIEYTKFYKYMDAIELPTSLPYSYEILQENKLFLGWNRELEKMPNSDTVLYATYSEVLSSTIMISFEKFSNLVYATDADIRISSSATELVDITRNIVATDEDNTYFVKYPSTTPSLWVKMPGDSDYKYIDKTLTKTLTLSYIYVEIEENEHYERGGEGYYLGNTMVMLNISPNTGYSVETIDSEYVIYNGIISFEVMNSVSIGISVTQNNYYILYYVNEEYYSIQENLHYNDVVEMLTFEKKGFSFSGWDKIIDVMPAENVVVYGTYTARIELSITLNYNDSTLIDENSLYISNSYENGGSVVKGELDGNTFKFAYTGKMYLWLYDSYLGGYKYIDSEILEDFELNLFLISAPSQTHFHLNGLGYYKEGSSARITPVVDDGYYITYNGEKVTDDIIISHVTSNMSISCSASKETYKIYYYVSGELYQEDSYEFDADVVMAEYDWNGSDYERWNQPIFKMPAFNINIYAVERANAFLYQMPTVTVHKSSTLGSAMIEGGIVLIGDSIEDGTFKFNDADEVITLEGSHNISFIPSNPIYKEYMFPVNVLVCNPMYSEELIEPEVLNVTINSIKLSINAHYEYSVDGGDYYQGGIVNITGLDDNTSYRIEYRYMDDNNYCHSKSKSIIVKTLSADEELYNACVNDGNEMLSSYERLIDNEIIQRYLALYKAELRKGYDSTSAYFGAKLAEKLEYIEGILQLTYKIELKRNESLLNTARIDLFTENRLNEIIDLAFENETPINNIKSFSDYVIGVFDSSNTLIRNFDLNLNPRARIASGEDKLYVTDKIDELLDYNYDSYSLINLNSYVSEYVTPAAVMISGAYDSIHMCDGQAVYTNILSKVSLVSAKTYLDYSFNRSEYDKAFYEAAEAAVISHIQAIVLESLTLKYNNLIEGCNDTKRINKYTKNYEAEYAKYSSYESFKLSYESILEGKDESFTYEDLLNTYDVTLDNALKLKSSARVSDVEVLIIFVIVIAVVGCGVAAVIIRRRRNAI